MELNPRIIREQEPGGGFVQTESGDRSWLIPAPSRAARSLAPKELEKRTEYRDYLRQKAGLPDKRPDMSKAQIIGRVDEMTSEHEQGLFENFFGDFARYEDRKHLDSKAQNAWKSELLRMRKRMEIDVRGEFEGPQADYDRIEEEIDNEMKTFDDYNKMITPARPKHPTAVAETKRKEQEKKDEKAVVKEEKRIAAEEKKRLTAERDFYNYLSKIQKSPTESQVNHLNVLGERIGMSVEDTYKEAIEGGFFSSDVPSSGGLEVSPLDMTPNIEATQQGLGDAEIADILKQNGYPVTPENVAKFKANNQG